MGLDVWFRGDIEHILCAAELASSATARAMERQGVSEPEVVQYRQGYRDALAVIAAAFDVEAPGGNRANGLQCEWKISSEPIRRYSVCENG